MRVEVLLTALIEEQGVLARQALACPAKCDAFEYGRAVGMHAGLQRAIAIITGTNAEEEKKGANL